MHSYHQASIAKQSCPAMHVGIRDVRGAREAPDAAPCLSHYEPPITSGVIDNPPPPPPPPPSRPAVLLIQAFQAFEPRYSEFTLPVLAIMGDTDKCTSLPVRGCASGAAPPPPPPPLLSRRRQ